MLYALAFATYLFNVVFFITFDLLHSVFWFRVSSDNSYCFSLYVSLPINSFVCGVWFMLRTTFAVYIRLCWSESYMSWVPNGCFLPFQRLICLVFSCFISHIFFPYSAPFFKCSTIHWRWPLIHYPLNILPSSFFFNSVVSFTVSWLRFR